MPAFLPPNLLALFAPRPPLDFLRPVDQLPWERDREEKIEANYSGVFSYFDKFEKKEDQPLPIREETRVERKQRIKKVRLENHKRQMQDELMEYDPSKNKKSTIDPYKTLFVAKLDYDTTEKRLAKEFEQYGHIAEIKLVLDKITGKSKGYAFIEFESERDMRQAYKYGEGMKIDGRKIQVDVERGRSVQGWRPRRFGGGLGDTRKEVQKKKEIKPEVQEISLRDGPQHGQQAFDQMRKFGSKDESTRDRKRREEKENTNYGGFGVDRSKFGRNGGGTGKYNPGNEAWSKKVDGVRESQMFRVSNTSDVNETLEAGGKEGERTLTPGARTFDSRRDRKREGGGDDGGFDKSKIKREKKDRYEGYGGGARSREDDRDDRNVKREARGDRDQGRDQGRGRGGDSSREMSRDNRDRDQNRHREQREERGGGDRNQSNRHRDGRIKSAHEMQRARPTEPEKKTNKWDYERQ